MPQYLILIRFLCSFHAFIRSTARNSRTACPIGTKFGPEIQLFFLSPQTNFRAATSTHRRFIANLTLLYYFAHYSKPNNSGSRGAPTTDILARLRDAMR